MYPRGLDSNRESRYTVTCEITPRMGCPAPPVSCGYHNESRTVHEDNSLDLSDGSSAAQVEMIVVEDVSAGEFKLTVRCGASGEPMEG